MARPLRATDDDIIEAARKVLRRRGPEAFSLSEVAREAGLSRAAVIVRFRGATGLQKALWNQLSCEFEQTMAGCAAERGAEGLLEIAGVIGKMAGTRENFSRSMTSFYEQADNVDHLEFQRRRGRALGAAIVRVMPQTSLAHEGAVRAFRSHLVGSLVAWQGSGHSDAESFLIERTIDWLCLAGIPLPAAPT